MEKSCTFSRKIKKLSPHSMPTINYMGGFYRIKKVGKKKTFSIYCKIEAHYNKTILSQQF